jgi:predicted RNA-binding Zn-ribbon protein involved in translation (DUF1610 family)
MSVIEFPGGSKPPPKKGKPPRVTTPDIPHNRLHMGPINFTCPKCANVIILQGENIIFRTMDFYCSSCGVLHRLTNPAFSDTQAPKNRKPR